jgi:hypothetical protein
LITLDQQLFVFAITQCGQANRGPCEFETEILPEPDARIAAADRARHRNPHIDS